jgi:hypothetical protein
MTNEGGPLDETSYASKWLRRAQKHSNSAITGLLLERSSVWSIAILVDFIGQKR